MSAILRDNEDLRDPLNVNDMFLLDRGFRDCLDEMRNEYKLDPKMPALLGKQQKQLTSEDANMTRLVTKCRWVVKAINGFLKSFKALKQATNKSLPHTYADYRIACSLINKFFKRLFSDHQDVKVIVQNMKDRLPTTNELKEIVTTNNLHLKSKFFSSKLVP